MNRKDIPFRDHFSGHAQSYAAYRPTYPVALFEWLSRISPSGKLAWDCATGNGQAALALANLFEHVVATDASSEQIREAPEHPRVSYRVEPAERSANDHDSVDLVTVGQAYHWFDHKAFLQEAGRVLKARGVLAIWTYKLAEIETRIDELIFGLYDETLDKYWPPERRFIDRDYEDFSLPWTDIETPRFVMEATWTLPQLMGYLNTWSALQRFVRDRQFNPLEALENSLSKIWGDPDVGKQVSWPLIVKACRAPG